MSKNQKIVGRWNLSTDTELTQKAMLEISEAIKNGATNGRFFNTIEIDDHEPFTIVTVKEPRIDSCICQNCGHGLEWWLV
jgi:hypothetical protein